MLQIGNYNRMTCLRKTDLGYMLTDQRTELLLHFKQATKELVEGEEVNVFVFYDSIGRLAATMEEPFATTTQAGWVEVISVKDNLGVFVHNNTFKDVLISKDKLPMLSQCWPQPGDKLLIVLKEKNDRLLGKVLNKEEIRSLRSDYPEYVVGETLEGHVVRVTENAINVLTDDLIYIYISKKQFREMLRLGERTTVTILGRHDDEYVGTLNKVKEALVDEDEAMILQYLRQRNVLPLTAKSSAEEVERYFHMSRKAFKRALGALYKKQEIYFEQEKTYIVKK